MMINKNKIWLVILLITMLPYLIFADVNPVKNSSFEKAHFNWVANWLTRAQYESPGSVDYMHISGQGVTGNHCIAIRNNMPNNSYAYQYVNVKPRTVYKISGWIYAQGIVGDVGANIGDIDSGVRTVDFLDTKGQWKNVEVYGITGEYQTKLPVAVRVGAIGADNAKGYAMFDDIKVEVVKTEPENDRIQSFLFYDAGNQEIIDKYFSRVKNKQYTQKGTHISFFFSIFLFLIVICFSLYSLKLKGKNKLIDNIIEITFRKYFYILIALFFIIFFVWVMIKSKSLTMFDTQLSFIIIIIMCMGIAIYLYRKKQLTPQNIAKIIIVLAIGLRLCYFLYTDQYVRQHDLWGAWSHIEYINHIATHLSLPDVGTHQAYHPPLHYIISAVIFKITKLFRLSTPNAYRAVEMLMVFLSSLGLIFIYKILKLSKCPSTVLLIGIAFAGFLPGFIYMSVYLNNDQILMFFYTIAFFYLLKWVNEKNIKNTVLLAFFTALAMLSKKSAIILYIIVSIVFIVEFIKNRKNYKQYIKLGIIFIIIALPLGMSFQIRNYILFQQDLSYSYAPITTILPNNPYNLFYISFEKLLEQPFSAEQGVERVFTLMELIRTSLFSTFPFYITPDPGVIDIAVLLMFFTITNIVIVVIFFIFFRKKNMEGNSYIFLINLICVIIMYYQMRITSPYHTTHAFRYIGPTIAVSLSYFVGQANYKFIKTDIPVIRYFGILQFCLFCIFSGFFILMIGFK